MLVTSKENMDVEIRLVQSHEEYRAVEQIQREVWGLEEVEVVPDHLLVTAQKNGGLVLGAFDLSSGQKGGQLVGFVFGLVGLSPDGKIKHCSHMTGVAPDYQNQNLGYHLKLAQREHVLMQGLDLITWTFDPLESRNAYLNFRKLGVTCQTYLRDLYGSMRDTLNIALPSDRFQVDWHIASTHVADRLSGKCNFRRLSSLGAEGVPLLNHTLSGDPPRPEEVALPIQGTRLLIQIPAHFQTLKTADMELARAWRLQTRALFEAAFAEGYVTTDLLFEDEQSYYLLEKNRTPDENRTR
jgi:predicted GNAT superfamily acetyltransferase